MISSAEKTELVSPWNCVQSTVIPRDCVHDTVSDLYSLKEYCSSLQCLNFYVLFTK
jgi:hypothetical protein